MSVLSLAEVSVAPDPEVMKLYAKLRELQAEMYTVTEELGRRIAGGEPWGPILKRLETAFDLAWCGRYAPGRVGEYSWNLRLDRGHMKRFHRRYGEAELIDRFGVYLKNNDPFFAKNRHTFGVFVSSVNQHVLPREAVRTPWCCPHRPACGSPALCAKNKILNDARRAAGKPLLVNEVEAL